jgi:hypothetical protein
MLPRSSKENQVRKNTLMGRLKLKVERELVMETIQIFTKRRSFMMPKNQLVNIYYVRFFRNI